MVYKVIRILRNIGMLAILAGGIGIASGKGVKAQTSVFLGCPEGQRLCCFIECVSVNSPCPTCP
jgi:hypothetical protein